MMDQDMAARRYEVRPVAWVESQLKCRTQAPRQGNLGAPPAWLDRARRFGLATVPDDNPVSPPLGVFSTRSPDRPNPIGPHRARILAVEGLRILVSELEALVGTPVIDIKPVIDLVTERSPGPATAPGPAH